MFAVGVKNWPSFSIGRLKNAEAEFTFAAEESECADEHGTGESLPQDRTRRECCETQDRRRERERCHVREAGGDLLHRRLELVVRNHPVHEPDAFGFGCVDHVGEQDELLGAVHADQ